MRWYILRTLLYKEILRHLADRGLIFVALFLLAAALLLSFTGKNAQTASLTGGVQMCFIDFGEEDPWVQHLMAHVPPALEKQIQFRSDRPKRKNVVLIPRNRQGVIVYPPGQAAIQIRHIPGALPRYGVQFWHPSEDGGELAPFEAWFWKEWNNYSEKQVVAALAGSSGRPEALVKAAFPDIEEEHKQIQGGIDTRSAIAMALVLFALYVPCVYLLPSLTCEERERGVLLAQALSPASPLEILAAKFLFYPVLGIGLAALLAGIYNPAVLGVGFFWLALFVAAWGTLGVGMTVACLARTQRRASMGALCYVLAIALIMLICQQNNLPLSQALIEYHIPRMIHAVLQDTIRGYGTVGFYWWNLLGATILAGCWVGLATWLFRRRGWQ
jgi:ABC-type Na+ efflux pump permease subunit